MPCCHEKIQVPEDRDQIICMFCGKEISDGGSTWEKQKSKIRKVSQEEYDQYMDTAKAVGIIINNPEFEDVRSLEGVADTKKPCVPIIAVPTTAGTAAEVTINYVITDVEKKRNSYA